MTINYIKACMEDDNTVFKVNRLKDLTEDHFKMACMAAMTEKTEIRCFAGISTSSDLILYEGRKKARVEVSSWSGMLTLFIVSEGGTWIESSHIEGPDAEEVLDEAWKHYQRARPFITKTFDKAFKKAEPNLDENNSRWMEVTLKYYKLIEDYFREMNGDEDGSGKEL